ncbi:FAD:protein FMN transferase [Candidatus Saccharibacteria bacterium]|nr:MAG: FAD:protein FMN transferase [Candidatus Saccharibacteria bacterium]
MPSTPSKSKLKLEFESIGTHWVIERAGGIAAELEASIHETLEVIDKTWSRFRDDSLVATMAQNAGTYELSPADTSLVGWYRNLYDATDGAVTPLIGQTLADAGYDSQYSLRPKEIIHTTPSWDDRLSLRDNTLDIKKPTLIDVGAAGKGFAIDAVAALLGDSYTVDAGGDIRLAGHSETIGLEHPLQPGMAIGTVTVSAGSICGSAGNRRAWGDGSWHHILDPRTSKPTAEVLATWAIAPTAMEADGLATALFFVPPETLQNLADFLFIVLYADGSVRHTKHKDIELFT